MVFVFQAHINFLIGIHLFSGQVCAQRHYKRYHRRVDHVMLLGSCSAQEFNENPVKVCIF